MTIMKKRFLTLLLIALGTVACRPEPEAIRFGEDQCAYCKMMIADSRYGAELVTEKGKVFKFDAAECMVNYMQEGAGTETEYAFTLAIAADTPGELHPVEEMSFLVSPNKPSPMGANLTGFSSLEIAEAAREENGGTLLDWEGVVDYIQKRQ
jgi:copper chaperone NosL